MPIASCCFFFPIITPLRCFNFALPRALAPINLPLNIRLLRALAAAAWQRAAVAVYSVSKLVHRSTKATNLIWLSHGYQLKNVFSHAFAATPLNKARSQTRAHTKFNRNFTLFETFRHCIILCHLSLGNTKTTAV